MKINYTKDGKREYFDMEGNELHENDIVHVHGRYYRVILTDQELLGADATNPVWLKDGRAVEAEYGVYPFSEYDEPVLVCRAGEYTNYDPAKGEFKRKNI